MFYENRLGNKKGVICFGYLFSSNTGTKFRDPYFSNHVIPHRDLCPNFVRYTPDLNTEEFISRLNNFITYLSWSK